MNFEIDEVLFIGEVVLFLKIVELIVGKDVFIGDCINMMYFSIMVVKGRGCGIVVFMGMFIEIGKIFFVINEIVMMLIFM